MMDAAKTKDKTKDNADRSASRRDRIDTLLDEALQESFPASDAISIASGEAAIEQDDVTSGSGKAGSGK